MERVFVCSIVQWCESCADFLVNQAAPGAAGGAAEQPCMLAESRHTGKVAVHARGMKILSCVQGTAEHRGHGAEDRCAWRAMARGRAVALHRLTS